MSREREVYTIPVTITDEEALDEWIKQQEKPIVEGEDVARTMLPTWNNACRDQGGGIGLARGWHTIIGGNTGHGKSLAGLNLAASAMRSGMTVGFISLEMSLTQLQTRFYAILTGRSIAPTERGESYDPEATRMTAHAVEEIQAQSDGKMLSNLDMYAPLRYLDEVFEQMDRWREDHECGLFVLDYMQLIGAREMDDAEINKTVGLVSRSTMDYAREHNVITVGISQFNRTTSRNYDHSPTPQGLFGWSGMENDAHQVILIDHSRYREVGKVAANGAPGAKTWILVAKNRHGMSPEIPVYISYKNLQVREALDDEVSRWPTHT